MCAGSDDMMEGPGWSLEMENVFFGGGGVIVVPRHLPGMETNHYRGNRQEAAGGHLS